MIKRVVCFGPQLHINAFSEAKVPGDGDVPVIHAGTVECSSVPRRADFALGRKCEHIRVEIVVEGALALGQHWIPSEDDLGSIAPAGDVLVVCRAQVDIHGLAGDERGYPRTLPVVQCPAAEPIVPVRAHFRQFPYPVGCQTIPHIGTAGSVRKSVGYVGCASAIIKRLRIRVCNAVR